MYEELKTKFEIFLRAKYLFNSFDFEKNWFIYMVSIFMFGYLVRKIIFELINSIKLLWLKLSDCIWIHLRKSELNSQNKIELKDKWFMFRYIYAKVD